MCKLLGSDALVTLAVQDARPFRFVASLQGAYRVLPEVAAMVYTVSALTGVPAYP